MGYEKSMAAAANAQTEKSIEDIFSYAARLLNGGASRSQIEVALSERGLAASSSAIVLDNLFRVKALKAAGLGDIITGGLWCLAGILITALTYAAASSESGGGTYFVAWGAVVFGGYQALRGSVRLAKCAIGGAR